MSKRQLILGAILSVLAIGPMVDSASADQRIWRRLTLPSYLEGDPEWPTGTLPTIIDSSADDGAASRSATQPSVSTRVNSCSGFRTWWLTVIRRLCWNLA